MSHISMPPRKRRNWVFTANRQDHVGDEGVQDIIWDVEARAFAALFGEVKLLSFQLETAPQTGRFHWQGYVEFPNPRHFSAIQAIYQGIHLEVRRGSKKQAIDYSRKRETRHSGPWLFPEGLTYEECVQDNRGKRTDIEDAIQILVDGGGPEEVIKSHPGTWVRYSKGITAAAELLEEKKHRDPLQVLFIYGPTGTGKSHWVYTAHAGLDVYRKGPGKWFDDYAREEVIVFDDFDWSCISIQDAMVWLDRWPMRGETKGSHVKARWKRVIIISNTLPDSWWAWADPAHMEAFNRRITHRVDIPARGDIQWKQGSADDWNDFFIGEAENQ